VRQSLNIRSRAALAALLLCCWLPAGGAELRSVTVTQVGARYHLVSEAWFAASREDLYRVLTDYDLFSQFSSVYVDTRNLAPDDLGRPRFYTRMEGCMLFFCKSFRRNGYLVLTPPREIVAVADPADSDFNYSRERWRLKKDGDGTLMTYDFKMEPSFWVPPVIGPFVIKRTLRHGGADAINRIEALALGRQPDK